MRPEWCLSTGRDNNGIFLKPTSIPRGGNPQNRVVPGYRVPCVTLIWRYSRQKIKRFDSAGGGRIFPKIIFPPDTVLDARAGIFAAE